MKRSLVQIACVAVPKVAGGVLAVALNALLMRHLGPAEFGVYAVCLTLVALADGVLGSAIDMSVVKLATSWRLQDAGRARRVEAEGIKMKAVLSLAVLVCAALAAPLLSAALFHREDAGLLMTALATAAGVLLLRSGFLHLQLEQRFAAYAGLEAWAQALRVAGIGGVIALGVASAWHLSLAALAGTALALVLAAWWTRGVLAATGRSAPTERRELWRTLRWVFLTFAFSSLVTRLDVFLLTQWSTMDQVGLYAGGQVFAQIPELLGTYLAVVFSPKVAPASINGTLGGLLRRVQLVMLLAAVVIACVAYLALHGGAGWLPASYTRSRDVLLILLAGTLAAMCAFPVVIPYVMFARPRFIFQMEVATLPFVVPAYWYAIQQHGAIGAAWVTGLSRLIKLGFLQACTFHWARQGVQATATTTT